MSPFDLAAMLAVAAIVVLLLLMRSTRNTDVAVNARQLMSAREHEALVAIEEALPACRVHAKVALSALIERAIDAPSARKRAAGKRLSQAVVDFVIQDKGSGKVRAIVELNGPASDKHREFSAANKAREAGYRVVRLSGGSRLDRASVRDQIMIALVQRNEPDEG